MLQFPNIGGIFESYLFKLRISQNFPILLLHSMGLSAKFKKITIKKKNLVPLTAILPEPKSAHTIKSLTGAIVARQGAAPVLVMHTNIDTRSPLGSLPQTSSLAEERRCCSHRS